MKAIVLVEKVGMGMRQTVRQTVESVGIDALAVSKECDLLNKIMKCDGLTKGYIVEEVEIVDDFVAMGFNRSGDEVVVANVLICRRSYQLSTVILDRDAEMDSEAFADYNDCEITEI